jgi:hypothetical protein
MVFSIRPSRRFAELEGNLGLSRWEMSARKQKLAQAVKNVPKKRAEKRSARQSRNTKRADEFKLMRKNVDEFAKTHPGFDKLAEEIIFWLNKKLNLDDAYLVSKVLDKAKVKLGRATP